MDSSLIEHLNQTIKAKNGCEKDHLFIVRILNGKQSELPEHLRVDSMQCEDCGVKIYRNGETSHIVQFEFSKEKTETQRKKEHAAFVDAAKPLMKYLADNYHPHVTVIVTPTTAELMEGLKHSGPIMDFVKD